MSITLQNHPFGPAIVPVNDRNTGILGIGVKLPDAVRYNDAWPEDIIERWQADQRLSFSGHCCDGEGQQSDPSNRSDGEAGVIAALAKSSNDAFRGSRERRILDRAQISSDIEVAACHRALDDAGINASAVDFVLGFSAVPDHLGAPNVCAVHRRLGLRETCLALNIEASFNAFAAQVEIACGFIASGNARYGLLYQSSALSRLVPMDAHYAPWFGDGATAVVVGPVPAGWGLLGSAHRTDGRLANAMMVGVPGRRWYQSGRIQWYPGRADFARSLLVGVVDRAAEVVHEALASANICASMVDFYASHQPTVWFRRITQHHTGLTRARSLDTFSWTGSLGAANAPLMLGLAQKRGKIRSGDVVAIHTGGLGVTWSGLVMRWGVG